LNWIGSEVTPSSPAELAVILSRGHGTHRWMPKGGGTLLGRGALPKDPVVAINVSRCRAVIEHAYDDLTVTVEAGIRIAELQATLSRRGQWLPLSVNPDPESTVGGWIGADRRTPLAGSGGSIRDYLLGMAWLDGRGQSRRAGGRVVKNVAGYDFMKLFTGSLGEFGVVTEATFKVLPEPPRWGGVTWSGPNADTLHTALTEGPKLFPAGLWRYNTGEGDRLGMVFAGSPTRVLAQVARAERLFSIPNRVLDREDTLALISALERDTRPETNPVAWGGALPEWLCRSGLGDVFQSSRWCADLLRGHVWSEWNADESALSRAREALRSGDGQLHLDAPSGQPLAAPWGRQGDDRDILLGLKRALDPEGRFVEGRWPFIH
jgi:FAD binding domain-containing protein